ncbi:hypothetical protein PENTCL1PPCAC_1054, partial [Pristionchus entomophagus]
IYLGSGGCGNLLHDVGRSADKRCTGVGDDLPSLGVGVGAERDGSELELVVRSGGEGLVSNHSTAVRRVDSSISVDSTSDVLLSSLVLEPHCEEGRRDFF